MLEVGIKGEGIRLSYYRQTALAVQIRIQTGSASLLTRTQ